MPGHRTLNSELKFAAVLAALGLLACAPGCRDRNGPPSDRAESAAAAAKAPDQGKQKLAAEPSTAGQTVQLVIDYGDGVQKRFPAIAWRENMTVLDVLETAKDRPHGITYSVRGSGETTLLTKLDDVANQEGATDAKNWIFYVNDRMADKSLGVISVKSGTLSCGSSSTTNRMELWQMPVAEFAEFETVMY